MFANNYSNGLKSTSNSLNSTSDQNIWRTTNSSNNCLSNNYQLFGITAEQKTTSEELRNKKYKEKCCRLQKQIRHLIFINNAIHSELNQSLNKLSKTSDERRFLLNKILPFNKDTNQETISSRILQEALSKKHSSKFSSVSISSQTSSQSLPIISSSQSLSQTTISGTESESLVSNSTHLQQFNAKFQIDRKSNLFSNDWITQTVSTESQTGVGPNKRIKLIDCPTSLKKS